MRLMSMSVTVVVKVVNIASTEIVKTRDGKEVQKQDCKVVDASGCVRVVLWEDNTDALKEGCCFKLRGVGLRVYGGVKYLTVGGSCVIEELDGDIGEVYDESSDSSSVVKQEVVGEIDSVLSCEEYSSCWMCKGKVKVVNAVVGECGKCHGMVKLSKCKSVFIAN